MNEYHRYILLRVSHNSHTGNITLRSLALPYRAEYSTHFGRTGFIYPQKQKFLKMQIQHFK